MIPWLTHTAIFGTTGSGKSTTLRSLLDVPYVLFDMKGEASGWPAIQWREGLRIAAYDLDLAKYLDASPAGENVLADVLARRGVIATLEDLEREVKAVYAPTGTKEALLRSIRAKRSATWVAEPTVGDLFPGSHVVAAGDGYAAQVDWLLRREIDGDESPLRGVIVFEEAHLLRELDLATAAKMLRSKGVGLVFVTQHPRDLDPSVLAVCNTRIYHRILPGTPGERAYLRELPRGVESLGVGECLINDEVVRIKAREAPASLPWVQRQTYKRGVGFPKVGGVS
jgi:DNA helicase HerA-like ATPase